MVDVAKTCIFNPSPCATTKSKPNLEKKRMRQKLINLIQPKTIRYLLTLSYDSETSRTGRFINNQTNYI